MSSDIIQNQFNLSGQSQTQRSPRELAADFVVPDERDSLVLLEQACKLAQQLRLYQWSPQSSQGDWSSFFPADQLAELMDQLTGKTPPHLGLLLAFLQLYRYPQQQLNQLTSRHLLYQFRDVLRFEPQAARPDRAHLVLALKKQASPVLITPSQRFSAGKDATGVERLYRPLRDTVINAHQVEKLCSVLREDSQLRFAVVANSADGLGAELTDSQPHWSAFGELDHPLANIGLALASSTLRLAGGQRKVVVKLGLNGLTQELTANQLAASFQAYFTGPEGWLGPFSSQHSILTGQLLQLEFNLSATDAAVVDYQVNKHGHAFSCQTPLLQLLLKQQVALSYPQLQALTVSQLQIEVVVEGLAPLGLENDDGKLNPKKAFLPFGSQPSKGARFKIDCPEALSKKLQQLTVKLDWAAAPSSLSNWYSAYQQANRLNNGIRAWISYSDAGQQNNSFPITLISNNNSGISSISTGIPPLKLTHNLVEQKLSALLRAGSFKLRQIGQRLSHTHLHNYRPRIRILPPPDTVPDRISIELLEDFLHADYRRETLYNTLNKVTDSSGKIKVLNEPYTPKVQQISLGYRAQSALVNIESDSSSAFANDDVSLFHLGCFGQRREHRYLRQQYSQVEQKQVPLLPEYVDAGELMIGIRGARAGDSVALLLQTAAGSADPDLLPTPLTWSVLCDNYWRKLSPQQLIQDSSQGLRDSGILITTLPADTSSEHSWMPSGLVWLRATITHNRRACNRLFQVASNAIAVEFVDSGNDPNHLLHALPALSINKAKPSLAAIQSVSQPFASFGGYPRESDAMLVRRASERLRHRNRCVSAWDYERLVLEHFPQLYKVKCINHAKPGSWQAPGHVRLVLIPKLAPATTLTNSAPPKVDVATLDQVQQLVQQHCSQRLQIHVSNPHYQTLSLTFKARFHAGCDFHYYRSQLELALIQQLSPWLLKQDQINFGGRIYRSVLLNFVEQQPYVDFVSDFQLGNPDQVWLAAQTPDTILISADNHDISEYVG